MTATRREAIQLLERVPEDKLTYVVQILSSIDGLISISDRRTKKIDLDQFVMLSLIHISEPTRPY